MYDFIQKIVQKNPEANPTSSAKKGKKGKKKKGKKGKKKKKKLQIDSNIIDILSNPSLLLSDKKATETVIVNGQPQNVYNYHTQISSGTKKGRSTVKTTKTSGNKE